PVMKTYAPSFTNRFAVARPMPLLSPVISAIFPSSLPIWFSLVVIFLARLCLDPRYVNCESDQFLIQLASCVHDMFVSQNGHQRRGQVIDEPGCPTPQILVDHDSHWNIQARSDFMPQHCHCD